MKTEDEIRDRLAIMSTRADKLLELAKDMNNPQRDFDGKLWIEFQSAREELMWVLDEV